VEEQKTEQEWVAYDIGNPMGIHEDKSCYKKGCPHSPAQFMQEIPLKGCCHGADCHKGREDPEQN